MTTERDERRHRLTRAVWDAGPCRLALVSIDDLTAELADGDDREPGKGTISCGACGQTVSEQ